MALAGVCYFVGAEWGRKRSSRASNGNAAKPCAHQRVHVQSAGARGGDYPAVLLLRAGRSNYAVAVDLIGVFSRSRRGAVGTRACAAHHWRDDHGADPDRGAGGARLWTYGTNPGFCRELAEIHPHAEATSGHARTPDRPPSRATSPNSIARP